MKLMSCAARLVVKSRKKARNEEIVQLFMDGYTANEIGRMHNISKQRVSFILHTLGVRAEKNFTTVYLPDPFVVALNFGDLASAVMMDWSANHILPAFDLVIESSPASAHADLRSLSSRNHVLSYIPTIQEGALSGQEIRCNWLIYAYPLIESRFGAAASSFILS